MPLGLFCCSAIHFIPWAKLAGYFIFPFAQIKIGIYLALVPSTSHTHPYKHMHTHTNIRNIHAGLPASMYVPYSSTQVPLTCGVTYALHYLALGC